MESLAPGESQPGSSAPVSPFGEVTPGTAAVCRCGAGRHAIEADRCANGHTLVGHSGPALLTTARAELFWEAHEGVRREIRDRVIADHGCAPDDAPEALRIAAETIAQATLVRDSAYQRMADAGGPLSASGRARRCFDVWCAAVDRLERHLRLVGLQRKGRRINVAEQFAALHQERQS